MASPATSDWHLSKFGKRPKLPLAIAFGRILVVQRFACPTTWWASCVGCETSAMCEADVATQVNDCLATHVWQGNSSLAEVD